MFRIDWPLYVVKRVVVGIVACALLAAGGVVGVNWWEQQQAECAEGVQRRGPDQECIGVTDGSYAFGDSKLKNVTDKIKEENDSIKSDENFVSVAYMTTFTSKEDDSNSRDSMRRELEGAYLAQKRRNDYNGEKLKIKLLIANSGSGSRQQAHTVNKLTELKKSEHLVAVTGLGPSSPESEKAVQALSKEKLATVASIMTVSGLDDIDSFARVAPTNDDQAKAAAQYAKEQGWESMSVVQDENSDNTYADTLSDAFRRTYPEKGKFKVTPDGTPLFYNSEDGATPSVFSLPTWDICHDKPDGIYFAGRGKHLMAFLTALSERPRSCRNEEFTILAGDDTTNLSSDQIEKAAKMKIKVRYTGLAHPDMWPEGSKDVNERTLKDFQEGGRLRHWFQNDRTDDGQAMMGHDAVTTVSYALNRITAAPQDGKINGALIGNTFQYTANNPISGSSGFIRFDDRGQPLNKTVPILELGQDGIAKFISAVEVRD